MGTSVCRAWRGAPVLGGAGRAASTCPPPHPLPSPRPPLPLHLLFQHPQERALPCPCTSAPSSLPRSWLPKAPPGGRPAAPRSLGGASGSRDTRRSRAPRPGCGWASSPLPQIAMVRRNFVRRNFFLKPIGSTGGAPSLRISGTGSYSPERNALTRFSQGSTGPQARRAEAQNTLVTWQFGEVSMYPIHTGPEAGLV